MTSCLQPPAVTTSNDDIENNNQNTTENPIDVNQTITWNENQVFNKTLIRAKNTNKVSYLFGDDLHNYLLNTQNYNSSYCLVADFASNGSSSPKQYRVKVNPSFSLNNVTGKKDYYFRVSTSSALGNDFCNKQIETLLPNGTIDFIQPPASLAYYANEICTSCSNDLSSTSIKIYKYNFQNSSLVQVSNNAIKVDELRIVIESVDGDDNGNNGGGQTSCSDSSCNQDGFDCCVNNQCVNNKATIRDESELSPAELAAFYMAEAQKANNPNWYLQYPNFYYICPNLVDDDDDDNDDDNGGGDQGNQELAQRIEDFYCVNEMATYSQVEPFHDMPINPSHSYLECKTDPSQSGEAPYYIDVLNRLYANCGCDESYTTLQEKINNCPNYSYTATYEIDNLGNPTTNILNVQCFAPPADDNTPSTQIIEVNAKSAPHRYFNTDGVEIDMDKNPNLITNQTQEGSPFVYLDADYIFPQNGSFNMNSILGQMYVNLDLTKPARKIKVDFDKQYYLATLSGYYTPCPTCSKDSWYGQLSANPASGQGFGTQSIGYTTRRDSLGTNNSFGNYSDTHFGRGCFVPPTMLPFSQRAYSDVKTQRLSRLKTQAALFTNGYQKDWYGFNKGAMIGSFDGVTWFPIGNGRIVRSTSEYLYLAINAPYSDLAQANNHVISLQEWDGFTTATRFDFDPTKALNSTYQNQGATCQENYLCSTDSDCITKLGWEYNCQDVTNIKTKWPKFNSTTSSEVASEAREGSIFQFLQQAALPPGNNSKRCVYRGSGSVCRTDAYSLDSEDLRRKLSCAPNFYCANINTPSVFNNEIARFGAPLQSLVEANNHLFGKDANQLGRPKNYISNGNGSSLPSDVRSAITESVLLMDPTAANKVGLCLPGKALPKRSGINIVDTNPNDTHDKADPLKRTDYISQIAGCNSSLFSDFKYNSCPALNTDGNFETLTQDFYERTPASKTNHLSYLSASQNSCGFESLHSDAIINTNPNDDYIRDFSAFNSIEGEELTTDTTIVTPTLVANACLRRAGSVCHTNLDCSPNSKHSELIDIINPDFFGNEAEKNYWSEALVCGQGLREPNLGDSYFNEYDITNNRCCREIGSTVTLYSENTGVDINARSFASTNANDEQRYSRYSVVQNLVDTQSVIGNSILDPQNYVVPSADTNLGSTTNILNKFQWRTINETAKRTCCGGGWIRKFADGTNNWSINRLNLDINNFSCLNSRSPLTNLKQIEAGQIDNTTNYYNSLEVDKSQFCSDSDRIAGSCSDLNFSQLDFDNNVRPSLNNYTDTMKVLTYTAPSDGSSETQWSDADHDNSFFAPKSADGLSLTYLNWNEDFNNDSGQIRRNIKIKIPAYIPINLNDTSSEFGPSNLARSIDSVKMNSSGLNCQPFNWLAGAYAMDDATKTPSWNPPITPFVDEMPCAYTIDISTRVMYIAFRQDQTIENINPDANNTPANPDYGDEEDIFFAQINYHAPGTKRWEDEYASSADPTVTADLIHRRSSTPGEPLYYLEKLAKLELIGIPQMTFEPIYCNSNYQKLVPGIFDEGLSNVNQVINDPDFILSPSKQPWSTANMTPQELSSGINDPLVTTKSKLQHPDIFSSEEMMCCTPLGKETTDGTKCCSGFAAANDGDQTLFCKIPQGVNLNVYFNKFVSNEGTDPDSGSSVLIESDFDPETGAPKNTSTIIGKLSQLGNDFCENGTTRRGSAFGNFRPQPVPAGQGTTGQDPIYNIVDSFSDAGTNNGTIQSASVFGAGYRWNHNVYCN